MSKRFRAQDPRTARPLRPRAQGQSLVVFVFFILRSVFVFVMFFVCFRLLFFYVCWCVYVLRVLCCCFVVVCLFLCLLMFYVCARRRPLAARPPLARPPARSPSRPPARARAKRACARCARTPAKRAVAETTSSLYSSRLRLLHEASFTP